MSGSHINAHHLGSVLFFHKLLNLNNLLAISTLPGHFCLEKLQFKIPLMHRRRPYSHYLTALLLMGSTVLLSSCALFEDKGKHLFILSGQSNMWMLDLNSSFIPILESKYGPENIIVVKDSKGSQPIYRWVKNWRPKKGRSPKSTGDLYQQLMEKVEQQTTDQKIQTVTFVWMQGETDAQLSYGQMYKNSLAKLMKQLQRDLERNDINLVLGRLSDFDLGSHAFKHWDKVRSSQEKFAMEYPRTILVNTDDLNDNINRKKNKRSLNRKRNNDLHYSEEGYVILGERFAEAAIELINKYN